MSFRNWVVGWLALVLPLHLANTQTLTGLSALAEDLTRLIAEVHPEPARTYFLTAFAIDNLNAPIVDGVKALTQKFFSDGKARNLQAWLELAYKKSIEAKDAINRYNDQLPENPDYSHLEFCAQVAASADKIRRIEEAMKDLVEFREASQRYLRVMPGLTNASEALREFWNESYDVLAQYDAVAENTSLGTMGEQWLYWTQPPQACSAGDPCASFLHSEAWDNWKEVERLTDEKHKALKSILERHRAYHHHFYSASEDRCSKKEKDTEPDSSLTAELDSLVASASTTYEASWDDSMMEQVDALQRLLGEALRNATANARSGATLRLLQDALAIAQIAARQRDPEALVCAQSLMQGRPSASCHNYARSSQSDAYGGSGSCDPEVVARVQGILASCNKVTNSICGIAREGAACQSQIISVARSCPSAVAQATELKKSFEATAASVCTN